MDIDRSPAGGRIRSIGFALISPSSTHQRQNRRSDRKRVAAVAGLCAASWPSRNISTCSRLTSMTDCGRLRSLMKSVKHRKPSRYPDTVFGDLPAARRERAHDESSDAAVGARSCSRSN